MKKIAAQCLIFLSFFLFMGTCSAELLHSPYGNNELYGSGEAAHILWERTPHTPIAGEPVTLYAALDRIDREHIVRLNWTLNEKPCEPVSCTRYMEKDGKTIYRAKLPAFKKGDRVTYQFSDDQCTTSEFSFVTLDWEEGGCTVLEPRPKCFQMIADPKGTDPLPAGMTVRYLSDGENFPYACEFVLPALKDDYYSGFGMRYNAQNQHGTIIDHYTVNWYADQREKTYAPVPFYLCNGRYGFYADTDAYVRFDMAHTDEDKVKIYIELQNSNRTVYLFTGSNTEISGMYADVAGHAAMMPEWAFGVWLSANEWNRQSEAEEQLRLAEDNHIDVSVLVLEAWSDEWTFYRFSSFFPDPKKMVAAAHAQGTKVILWQIPVLKYTTESSAALRADEAEALKQGYVIQNASKTPYRMPDGWFGHSMPIDFTNESAVSWFLNKRAYLIKDIGIDGFKTDGGEFIWGIDTCAKNGLTGRELRNAYPDLYALSYQNTLDTFTFSRAAGRKANSHSLIWAGDQRSTFDEFQGCIKAMLNMNISGMPFVTFDIAGFSGDLPTSELYQRAVAFAAFTPVMQVHSEASGDPSPSRARTPWNMALCTGDPMCMTTFKKYADINAALRPYIMEQAALCCQTGTPLLKTMAYAFPDDPIAVSVEYQFMLGEKYLVAPVVKPRVEQWNVYLPSGSWMNYFTKETVQGGKWMTCSAKKDEIPVFEKVEAQPCQ